MGEMMIRFMPKGYLRLEQATEFEAYYGGDESIVAVSLAANKRLKSAEQRPASPRAPTGAQQHSHDRIQGYTAADENEFLHWKKQLDGFLAAGLIDRKEYNALLERRKTSYIGK